jgi:hypothetical protein
MLHLGIDGYGAEKWKLRKIDQSDRKILNMWCCRSIEKISPVVRVKIHKYCVE